MVALVVDDNCVDGSRANAIASAVGIAKHLVQAFALAIVKDSNQIAEATPQADANAVEEVIKTVSVESETKVESLGIDAELFVSVKLQRLWLSHSPKPRSMVFCED